MNSTGCKLETVYDSRNFDYGILAAGIPLPQSFELENVERYYQNGLDSCVGVSYAAAKSALEKRRVSPRFPWALAKRSEDYYGWGTYISTVVKQGMKYGNLDWGVLDENVEMDRNQYMRFDLTEKLLSEAAILKDESYWWVHPPKWDTIKEALFSQRIPLITSMLWKPEYNAPIMGYLPLPRSAGGEGHAFIFKGWFVNPQGEEVWKFQNSWGTNWGAGGDFYIFRKDLHLYGLGAFVILTDIPRAKAEAINKYNGKLIKTATSAKVYACDKGLTKHIEDELAFWLYTTKNLTGDVSVVTDEELAVFNEGAPIRAKDFDPTVLRVVRNLRDLYALNPAYAKQLLQKI